MADVAGAELETLDELVSAGLLRPDGAGLRFRHELSRLAVESAIAPHRRGHIHRSLMGALSRTACDDDARLAYHAEGAGDAALVARFAPRAARDAASLGAHREAAAQYERALRFPPQDLRELTALYEGYADSLAMVDRWPQAADARERAIALWQSLGDSRREAYDLAKLASVMWRLCRGPESVAAEARAIELLEPLGADPELARALSAQAFTVWRVRSIGRCTDPRARPRDG